MSAVQSSPDQAPAARSGDLDAPDTQYFQGILRNLVGMGHDLACKIHARAMAPEPEPTPESAPTHAPTQTPDPTIAFDRIAGCIRRTIALAQSLDHPRRAATQARRLARRRILRATEDAIAGARPEHPERLHAELRERLELPELVDMLEHDLATRPIDDIIAEITRDLGLGIPYGPNRGKRRTPKDVATLDAWAASPAPRPGPRSGPRSGPASRPQPPSADAAATSHAAHGQARARPPDG